MPSTITLALFSSYFMTDEVPDTVRVYLAELRRFHDRLVFITNDDRELVQADQLWLKTLDIELFPTRNEGYDFGMWFKALRREDIGKISRLTLANDSCVPLRRFDEFFQWQASRGDGYFGLINSNEIKPHIQSYFLVMTAPGIAQFLSFCEAKGPPLDYRDAIYGYELELTAHMRKNGLACDSEFNVSQHYLRNATIQELPLLLKMGFPLMKRRFITRDLDRHTLKYFFRRWGHLAGPYTASRLVEELIPKNELLDSRMPALIQSFKPKPLSPAASIQLWLSRISKISPRSFQNPYHSNLIVRTTKTHDGATPIKF
jgi:hypothetical protein